MRPSLKWLALAGLPALVPACFGSDNSNPTPDAATVDLDAGSTPDTTTPESEAAPPEASPPDAQADTYVAPEAEAPEASVDAGLPAVTVVVRNVVGPEPGVSVVFQDAFNEVLGTVTTDALGRASLVVPAGVQITAVMGTIEQPRLVTIQAVQPGDVLAVYDPTADGANGGVAVSLAPDAGAPPGTNSTYALVGHCYVPVPGTTTIAPDCQSQGSFPVLVVATAGADGGYGDFAYTYTSGTTATDGGVANVVAPGPWYAPLGSQTLTATNVDIDAGGTTGSAEWQLTVDSIHLGVTTPSTYYFAATDPYTDGVNTYPGFADSLQAEYNVTVFNSGNQSVDVMARKPLADGGATVFDSSQLLPIIDSLGFDTGSMILTWGSSRGSLAGADGVLAVVSWTDSTDAGAAISGSWTLVAPPGVVTARLPAIPAALQSLAPQSTAYFPTPVVAVVEADFVTGYDELRAQASTLPVTGNLVNGSGGNQAPPLPVDGTLRLTAITRPGD